MAYVFRHDESLPGSTRRIARELLEDSLDRLRGVRPEDLEEAVHEVRKNGKRLRALIRLVRSGMKHGRARERRVRDAGRVLSPLRDAHALAEAFERLAALRTVSRPDPAHLQIRRWLEDRQEEASRQAGREALPKAQALLREALDDVGSWHLERGPEVLREGLTRSYRAGREAMERCAEEPGDEAFHTWRKREKATWYHLSLLREMAPPRLDPLIGQWHALSEVLGDDHELALLAHLLREAPVDDHDAVHEFLAQLGRERAELRVRAAALGQRLYRQSPDVFGGSLAELWADWKAGTPE